MPDRDRTGPQGKGPKTGRQLGNCEGAIPTQEAKNCRGRCNRPRRCRFN